MYSAIDVWLFDEYTKIVHVLSCIRLLLDVIHSSDLFAHLCSGLRRVDFTGFIAYFELLNVCQSLTEHTNVIIFQMIILVVMHLVQNRDITVIISIYFLSEHFELYQ